MFGTILTVTSGKGGVGKTTAAGNLAISLAKLDQRVACIDLDIGLRNLDLVLGLENRVVYDLFDVIEGRVRWKQALVRHKQFENLFLLAASQRREKADLTEKQVVRLCQDMRSHFDFILIDCPAGIEEGFNNAIAPATEILIVATPEVSSLRDARRVVELLEITNKPRPRLVLNRVRPAMVNRGDMLSVSDAIELLDIELVGIILEDQAVIANTNIGVPVTLTRKSKAGAAFDSIARRLLGESIPLESIESMETISWKGSLETMLGRA